jgi:hypothetical protein
VAGAALAVWGLTWASEPVLPPGRDRLTIDGAENSHLDPVMLTTVVVSVVVVAAVISWLRRSRRRYSAADDKPPEVAQALAERSPDPALFAVLGVAVLVAAAWLNHLPSRVQFVRDHFMPTAQAPAAAGAWALTLAGTVVAAVVLSVSSRVVVHPHLTGAAVGVLAALVAVAGVVLVSGGGHNVDATTATDAPILAVPASLGERQFSLMVNQPDSRSQRDPTGLVAAGGNGFIVLEESGVRAYDSVGHERWHYLRIGRPRLAATAMQVYDDGHTVVIAFAGADSRFTGLVNRVVALDTVTGRSLWEADNFDGHYSLRAPIWMAEGSRYMFADDGEGRFNRIDTRTGKPIWSLQLNYGDCRVLGVDDQSHVSYASACLNGEEVTFALCR